MFNRYIYVQCCLMVYLVSISGYKILGVFPTPSLSHQVVFRPLMRTLAERGHEVYVMTPNPLYTKQNAPANYTEIDIEELSYLSFKKFIAKADLDPNNYLAFLKAVSFYLLELYQKQINTKEMQDLINGEIKFDLAIIETTFRSANAIGYKLKVPVIQISSLSSIYATFEMFGAVTHPFVYPEFYFQKTADLSLWEKIQTLCTHLQFRYFIDWELAAKEREVLRNNFGPNPPTLRELDNALDMLFINVNPIWENNRPVPPNVIYLGGMHQNPRKSWPNDLKEYLDSSKSGVIYMSFGTNVDPTMLPKEKIEVFCNVFSKLPFDVLWKWNGDELHCQPENVKISKWLPQSDLLRHPKVKVFITQAGLQSTDESITAGVPLIAFPMLGDQWYNAEKYVQHKIGMKMDFQTVTEQTLENAINSVIEDKSYRENILKLKKIVNDQPQTSLERAVWWTEYVLRHGGAKHLRSPMASVSWAEFLMLDVLAVVLGIAAVVLGLLVFICKYISMNFFTHNKLKIS